MKPQQILDLEQYWGIEIGNNNYEVNQDGQVISLDLFGNQISDLSPLKELKQLTELNLSSNQISDLSPLKELQQLTSLDLYNNLISDLNSLKELQQLTSLYLRRNQISDLNPIKGLQQLTVLGLSKNRIGNLSPLDRLQQLTKLDLRHNQISDLSPLKELQQLTELNLSHNQISNLSPIKGLIKKGIQVKYQDRFEDNKIHLDKNPLLTHPPVAIVKQGNEAILKWFDEYEKARAKNIQFQPLNEVRVIILGWGKVGKTTLRKRLIGEAVSENETQTDGIDIDIWQPDGLPEVALRVWDFGGQEIQHSVHNLFLQDNCVYLLVIDKRKDQTKNDDLVYWLEHIRSFGSDSPILIVENSIDTDRGITDKSTPEEIADLVYLNSEILQNFPDANIDYVGVSALKGYNIDTLKNKLFALAAQQNNKGLYPPDWLAAKNEVEQSITQGTELGGLARQNYITKETFDLECMRHQMADATAHDTLLNVMQQLGVVSYYKKSEDKSNWLILNPEWLTTAIYSVLLHPNLKRLNGHFQRSDVLAILSDNIETEEFFSKKKYYYSETEMGYVLDLMLDFELCFSPNNQDFYFPMGFKDNFQSHFVQENPKSISFLFDYETLPKAIWYKLLVRLFKHNVIERYWGSGVELKYNNTKGLIQINTLRTRRIQIWIDGPERIELLDIIRRVLDTVHEDFRTIPVTPKVFTDKGDEIKYQDLLFRFAQNIPTYEVAFGIEYVVKDLLRRLETAEDTIKQIDLIQRKQLSGGLGNTYINNYGTMNDMRGASITINQQARDISNDLAAIKEELTQENQAQIQALIDVLAEMQKAETPEKAKGALSQLRETMNNLSKIASEETIKWATKKGLDGLYDKIAAFGNSIRPDFMDSINLGNFA
jgi:internalin A